MPIQSLKLALNHPKQLYPLKSVDIIIIMPVACFRNSYNWSRNNARPIHQNLLIGGFGVGGFGVGGLPSQYLQRPL